MIPSNSSNKEPEDVTWSRLKKQRSTKDRDQGVSIEELRKKSRNEYFKKRAPQQIQIFEEDLRDEKYLFSDTVLTKAERNRIKHQEEVLKLAKTQVKAGEKLKQYYQPDDDKSDEETWEQSKLKIKQVSRELREPHDELLLQELLLDENFRERVRQGKALQPKDTIKLEREAKDRSRKLILETRKRLPVYERRDELLQAIAENQVIIVQGETGCGKTTQIPQYLHEDGYTKTELKDGELKIIGCTQPRRVAAMSVAARVSQEVGSKLGYTVGYSIRFEDCTSEGTVIKYMTDGMLLRELLDDPLLNKYAVMIVDEAHERTLHTDILLTLLKDVTRARSDFRLVISSATLDEQKFSHFFEDPPVFKIKGRLFHVEHFYMTNEQKASTSNITDACLRAVVQIHKTNEPGDILVFLPGQEEIEELQRDIESYAKKRGSELKELLIRPIYANLPTDKQAEVFEPTPKGARKVVIATNIAETSLTIDGIVFVIDPGFCKQNRFSSKTGVETLAITRISKASADQRAGRAGRNQPGKCFRLYTREEFKTEFEENTQPEIQRLNLANVVLLLKTMRIKDVLNFDYVDRPSRDTLVFAIEQLTALGALDTKSELTSLGRKMAEFPLDPKMSKAILISESYGCTEEVLTIMSMLSINGTVFTKPKEKVFYAEASRKSFFSLTGDHISLLKVYDDWAANGYTRQWCHERFIQYKSLCRARDVRDQLEKLCEKVDVKLKSDGDTINIRKAILGGFFNNVARISREGGSYRTVKKNQSVFIHPTSALHTALPRWIVFNEIKQTTKEYARIVSEIEPGWLLEVASTFYQQEEIEELCKKKMPKVHRGKSKADLNPQYG